MSLSVCDLILAAVLLLSLSGGWQAGTVNVLSRFASIFIAYAAARSCSGWLAWLLRDLLPGFEPASDAGRQLLNLLYLFCDVDGMLARLVGLVAFVLVFIVVLRLVRRLAAGLTNAFGHGLLAHINKLLGASLSLVITAVALIIANDILFPVLAGLGVTGPQSFLAGSRIVLPGIYRLLMLL